MSVCGIHARCHVAGKGITTFGSKFSQAKVLELASSCVLLVDGETHIASGVLIAPNVVLCAAHSIPSATANLQALLLFECDAKTAPGFTPRTSPLEKPPTPPPCTALVTTPQAKVRKTLENGLKLGLDYALLEITWTLTSLAFPRRVTLPRPDYSYAGELLAIGHPVSGGKGEHTQAAAGRVIAAAAHGPPPDPQTPAEEEAKEYVYADFHTTDGMSGGGVFNEKGSLVGIIKGMRAKAPGKHVEYAFLNIGLVASKIVRDSGVAQPASRRIKQWLGGGSPLLPGDPKPTVTLLPNTPALTVTLF